MSSLKPCPYQSASLPSRMVFSWANSFLKKGSQKVLTEDDVCKIHPSYKSSQVNTEFETVWEEEKSAALQESENAQNASHSSLLVTLTRAFGWTFLYAQIFRLVSFSLVWSTPYLLRMMIEHVENPSQGRCQGILLTAAFFLSQLLNSFVFEHFFIHCNMLSMQIRISMISAVFKKTLKISSRARRKYSMGEITNLMSVDASDVGYCFSHLCCLFLSPLSVFVIFYQLFQLVGFAAVVGLTATALLIPVNVFGNKKWQKYKKDLLKQKDKRMKLLHEVVNGIKALKLYAWEKCFRDKLDVARNREVQLLKKLYNLRILSIFTWNVAPYLVSILTFSSFIVFNSDAVFDAKTAFIAVSLLNILRYGMNETPEVIFDMTKIKLHLTRLQTFLLEDEHNQNATSSKESSNLSVCLQKGLFTWESVIRPTLKDINLTVPQGCLVAIVGHVGSGKSSLISAMLGEIEKLQGSVDVKGRVAYVPQQAWIQNDTLQNNILFGKPMNRAVYDEVLEATALKPDLSLLPGRDHTEIGEKGINLSGGQKQRVSLARAVYNDADIYLLDDPLSAVDSHVGKHIFDNVIGREGLLRNKTRLLVTHNVRVLPRVDTIVVMNNGVIDDIGSYQELLSSGGSFASVLKTYLSDYEENRDCNEEFSKLKNRQEKLAVSEEPHSNAERNMIISSQDDRKLIERQVSELTAQGKLIEEEKVNVGGVKWEVYRLYMKALGVFPSIIILGFYGLHFAVYMYSSIWLTHWTEDPVLKSNTTDSTERLQRSIWFLGVYTGLGVVQAFFILCYAAALSKYICEAAEKLHHEMLANILRCPMTFFDTTPLGMIANRFASDIGLIDSEMVFMVDGYLDTFCNVLGAVFIVCYSTPFVLAIVLPLSYISFSFQCFYLSNSRQLKRMIVKTQSPIFSYCNEAAMGSEVIRAFRAEDRIIDKSYDNLDRNQRFTFYNYIANRWLGIRVSLITNSVLASTVGLLTLAEAGFSGGTVGLAVSFAIEGGSELVWFLIKTSRLDAYSVSIERIMEYTDIPPEASWINPDQTPPFNWPRHGKIEFKNFGLRYREGLDMVLRNVSITIKAEEKVGIVGRTGAGKSSLTLALFRLIEPTEGAIFIDDINISSVGLHDLRSKLAIIPQDPVLFTGSLRMNLDPMEKYTDLEIWEALDHTHMRMFVESLPHQLLAECGEGGTNFSVGQRQLFCLARTLLKKAKILVMDEATAAVDMETDDLIQKTIRSEFQDCTILTIAHRLNTVMDYDRILVMESGKVVDFDSPGKLLEKKDGLFSSLARSADTSNMKY